MPTDRPPDALPLLPEPEAQIAKDCPACSGAGYVAAHWLALDWSMPRGDRPCPECQRVRAIVAEAEQRGYQRALDDVEIVAEEEYGDSWRVRRIATRLRARAAPEEEK